MSVRQLGMEKMARRRTVFFLTVKHDANSSATRMALGPIMVAFKKFHVLLVI